MAYCNRVSVKMASENSSEDEFETLHGPVRPYLFKPTAKPGVEWIKLPQRHAKLVLGSFNNTSSKTCFSSRTDVTLINYLKLLVYRYTIRRL